jgi:hypothetical protein
VQHIAAPEPLVKIKPKPHKRKPENSPAPRPVVFDYWPACPAMLFAERSAEAPAPPATADERG